MALIFKKCWKQENGYSFGLNNIIIFIIIYFNVGLIKTPIFELGKNI